MRRLFFILLLTAVAGTCVYGETRTLRMALFLLEPFMMEDPETGKATGAVVDYWKDYIIPRMGYDLEILGVFPIKRVEKMLESGEIEIAPLFTKISSRENLFLYPETHFAEVTSCLMVLPQSPLRDVVDSGDLSGLKIGFIEGGYIPPLLLDPSIILELVSNTDYRQINLNKLFNLRIDAALDINYHSLMYYLADRGLADRVRIVMLPVEPVKIYSIFRNTPDGAGLRAEYDRANSEYLREGVFSELLATYLR